MQVREFAPERGAEIEDGVDSDQLAAYFRRCRVVQQASHLDTDLFRPGGDPCVPVGQKTDGTNVWPMALEYYLTTYNDVRVPEWLKSEVAKPEAVTVSDSQLNEIRISVRRLQSSSAHSKPRIPNEAPDPFS